MRKKGLSSMERRQYIRLDSVFPVEFHILNADAKKIISDELQGFTSNVSRGGICLTVNNLDPALAEILKHKRAKLSLSIEIPVSGKPTNATAAVSWIKEVSGYPHKYLLGLAYEKIEPSGNKRIMRYALFKRMFAPAALSIVFTLALAFSAGTCLNIKLIKGNKALIEQLVKIIQESSVAKQKMKEVNKEKEDLQVRIQVLELQIKSVEQEQARAVKIAKTGHAARSEAGVVAFGKPKELNALIQKLSREKAVLQEQLILLQQKENTIGEELLRLDVKKASLEKANLDKMYQWLKVHQNPRTGLLMSFEGDGDVSGWAFIYDQSLAAQAYVYFSDFERARKALDFFDKKAKDSRQGFLNAYYAKDGAAAEYTVHSGPNIWLAIAAVQYTHKSKDDRYLALAEEIAASIINLQNRDKEGGLRGGPNVSWYATEHNLDAYALFNMLYKITRKEKYLTARDKALNWLMGHAYDKTHAPIQRGKGDSTIATGTYVWSIAAIGPEKLQELGMNPDMIIEFAEKNCSVEVDFARPAGGTVKIKGFDFAPQHNLARGGMVSSEWTAQMVIAFKIMSDFYYKKGLLAKGRAYSLKADEYLVQLANMVISSPSPSGQGESCLPYATQELADTGHGWTTLKGKTAGSVAGTAYTLFAYYNYNPLELKE